MIWVIVGIVLIFVSFLIVVSERDISRYPLAHPPPPKHSFPDTLVLRIANFQRYDEFEMKCACDWSDDAIATMNSLIDECRQYLEERK